jgi:hypothetical protein
VGWRHFQLPSSGPQVSGRTPQWIFSSSFGFGGEKLLLF